MTEKRFYMDKSGDLYDRENNLVMLDFGYSYDGVGCKRIIDLLNDLHEEVMDLRRENTKFKLTVREIIEDMQEYIDDNQLVYINQAYVDWIKKEVDTTLYPQKELKE